MPKSQLISVSKKSLLHVARKTYFLKLFPDQDLVLQSVTDQFNPVIRGIHLISRYQNTTIYSFFPIHKQQQNPIWVANKNQMHWQYIFPKFRFQNGIIILYDYPSKNLIIQNNIKQMITETAWQSYPYLTAFGRIKYLPQRSWPAYSYAAPAP